MYSPLLLRRTVDILSREFPFDTLLFIAWRRTKKPGLYQKTKMARQFEGIESPARSRMGLTMVVRKPEVGRGHEMARGRDYRCNMSSLLPLSEGAWYF